MDNSSSTDVKPNGATSRSRSFEKASCEEKRTENVEYTEFDPTEVNRVLKKVDWRLLPPLTLLYILAFIDRSNIGNAKIAGMNEELGLSGAQYNMALTVFFFPYAFFEIPSNIVLKSMRPSLWIGVLVVAWGTVMTLQGIVKNFHHLLVTRILLGATEAGFFPAATFLLTEWYCRWELQTRMAIFFSAASLSGGFSGLLAFGLQHMEGVGGLAGWRWIFIMEGIVTVVVGFTVPWILPDSPNHAKFLSSKQVSVITVRLGRERGESTVGEHKEKFKWKYFWAALTDWKIYLAIVIYWGNAISIYGFSFAAPTIIKQLGYTSAEAQLMTIPIYVVGAISTVVFARLADKRQKRWLFIVIPFSIALIGFIGVLSIPHPRLPGLTYFFLFFITGGLYPSLIGCVSWVGNNLAPSYKRAIGMALLMTVGGLGGAVGSNIFLQEQAPNYWVGYGVCAFIVAASIVSAIVLQWATKRINRKRDLISEAEVRARYTEDELRDLGDQSPLFRYVS
jgi:MFS family permease